MKVKDIGEHKVIGRVIDEHEAYSEFVFTVKVVDPSTEDFKFDFFKN